MIVMPAVGAGQEAAWHALLDLHEVHPTGWTLIGGQLVHLHAPSAPHAFAPHRRRGYRRQRSVGRRVGCCYVGMPFIHRWVRAGC